MSDICVGSDYSFQIELLLMQMYKSIPWTVFCVCACVLLRLMFPRVLRVVALEWRLRIDDVIQ